MDRNLLQRDVAAIIGANVWTIHNWETNAHPPLVRYYPAIMAWLGYCPVIYAKTLGERLRLHRHHRGLSAESMAKRIGVDPSTIIAWERNRKNPLVQNRSRKKIQMTIGLPHAQP